MVSGDRCKTTELLGMIWQISAVMSAKNVTVACSVNGAEEEEEEEEDEELELPLLLL